jgi:GTP 3',8-cyclase
MALVDSFGRTIGYLRVSVTDRCNLSCDYCRTSDMQMLPNNQELLTLEEIGRLIRLFVELEVGHIRLTGGEPLLRKNLRYLVADLAAIPGLKELSLSSNATLLARYAGDLKKAGLNRVNISLDSLQPKTFANLTRGGDLAPVLEGIAAAVAVGLAPVKINMVVMKGINDNEITDMVEYARQNGLTLRFIETMPIGEAGREINQRFVAAEDILEKIKQTFKAELIPVLDQLGSGPARYYRFAGTKADIGVISARSQHFCDTCNRMRLTSFGELVLCLGREDRLDLNVTMRNGASDDDLKMLIQEAVQLKPQQHGFADNSQEKLNHTMSSLGG